MKVILLFLLLLLNLNCKIETNLRGSKTYHFTVNGEKCEYDKDITLMRYLRDVKHITSVKDGCSQGACGACTLLIDGKAERSCIKKLSKIEGKNIITIEGLTQREKEVFTYAFSAAGSVQCGFCIPGMVMAAKALLDVNLKPTKVEIAHAIRNNICRCTGYKKIFDGILLAAKIFRENIKDFKYVTPDKIGQRSFRVDAPEKILAKAKYVDDMYIDGMLYGSAVRTKYPRAKILSIDTSEAKKLPGVRAVLTAEDVPGNNVIGHNVKDWDVMIKVGDITRFLGDAVALVAADTPEILEEAKKLVKVEYEELQGMFTPFEAMKEGAPKIHKDGNVLFKQIVKKGNADEVIKNSDFVVTKNYTTPPTEHAYMEVETALALYDKEANEALVYSTDQSPYDTQEQLADMLDWENDQVHVKNLYVGGAFGGKEGDMTTQHHALLLSYYTNLPVKVKLTRDESIQIHAKRHAAWIEMTTACDKNGKLTAMKATIYADTGAYASMGIPVVCRMATHAQGPYNYQVSDIVGYAVYTNNPPAGAFRGFGVTQSNFAMESNLNLLAKMVGISPWEIRYINAIRPGQVLPNGQIALPGTALAETLEAVKDIYEKHPRAGLACGFKNAGFGIGIPDWGRVKLEVKDNKIIIRTAATCLGQGIGTILIQIVSDMLRLKGDQVEFATPETHTAPDSMTSSGSRQTLVTGEACRRACILMKEKMNKVNGDLTKINGETVLAEYNAATDSIDSEKEHPILQVGYGYATQVVLLNEDGSVEKVVAAHDVGRAMNPLNIEQQIEGGVIMGLGFGLTEDLPYKNGKPTVKFGQLGLFRADKAPDVQSIIVEKNKNSTLAFGSVGLGELVSIPTAAAAQGAYFKYDGKFRTSLPLPDTFYSKKPKKSKNN